MTKSSLLFLLLFFALSKPTWAQNVMTDSVGDPQMVQAKGMVEALAYYYNLLGDKRTSVAEKETIINSSFDKLFMSPKVQVEDDLQENRSVVIYKDVQAYLKDIDFFFQEVHFDFDIREIEKFYSSDSVPYYRVELTRNLKAIGIDGDSINNVKQRYVELNVSESDDQLKIASIYTTKLSKEEQLREWWGTLTLAWKEVLQDQIGIYEDSLTADELFRIVTVDSLDLSENEYILDIEPIYQLTSLKYLKLSNTWVNSLGPLLAISKLKSLDISRTSIYDIQFLKYNTDIEWLNLSASHVEDFSILKNLPKLKYLNLNGISGTDLSFISDIKSLEVLSLTDAKNVESVDFFALDKLKSLDLSRSDFSEVTSLNGLSRLEILDLSETKISGLDTPVNLKGLKELTIENTSVSALSGLNSLPNLKKVYANGTLVDEKTQANFIKANPHVVLVVNAAELKAWWESIPDMVKSKIVNQHDLPDQSVEQLVQLIQVDSLNLEDTGLKELDILEPFKDLKRLKLDNNPITAEQLAFIPKSLELISLSNTRVDDLNYLSKLPKLKRVVAKKLPVRELNGLEGMSALRFLDLDGGAIESEKVAFLLDKSDGLTIRFMTEKLKAWWSSLPEELRTELEKNKPVSVTPITDELHELAASKALRLTGVTVDENLEKTLEPFYRLEALELVRAQLSGIGSLPKIKGLSSLSLNQIPINSLEGIEQFGQLKKLNLENTSVEDLRPLAALTELSDLNVSGTNVKRFRGLEELSKLETIDCSNTKVFRLDRLYALPVLKELTCFNTGLRQNDIDKFKAAQPEVKVVYY